MKKLISLLLALCLAFPSFAQAQGKNASDQHKALFKKIVENSELKISLTTPSMIMLFAFNYALGSDTIKKYDIASRAMAFSLEESINLYTSSPAVYKIVADSFTTAELKTIADFYDSDLGKRFMKDMGSYILDSKCNDAIETLRSGQQLTNNPFKSCSLAELKKIAQFQNTPLFKRFERLSFPFIIHQIFGIKNAESFTPEVEAQIKEKTGEYVKIVFRNTTLRIADYLNSQGCKIDANTHPELKEFLK